MREGSHSLTHSPRQAQTSIQSDSPEQAIHPYSPITTYSPIHPYSPTTQDNPIQPSPVQTSPFHSDPNHPSQTPPRSPSLADYTTSSPDQITEPSRSNKCTMFSRATSPAQRRGRSLDHSLHRQSRSGLAIPQFRLYSGLLSALLTVSTVRFFSPTSSPTSLSHLSLLQHEQ